MLHVSYFAILCAFHFGHINNCAHQYTLFVMVSVVDVLIICFSLVYTFACIWLLALARNLIFQKASTCVKVFHEIEEQHKYSVFIRPNRVVLKVVDPKSWDRCQASDTSLLDNGSPVSETKCLRLFLSSQLRSHLLVPTTSLQSTRCSSYASPVVPRTSQPILPATSCVLSPGSTRASKSSMNLLKNPVGHA